MNTRAAEFNPRRTSESSSAPAAREVAGVAKQQPVRARAHPVESARRPSRGDYLLAQTRYLDENPRHASDEVPRFICAKIYHLSDSR